MKTPLNFMSTQVHSKFLKYPNFTINQFQGCYRSPLAPSVRRSSKVACFTFIFMFTYMFYLRLRLDVDIGELHIELVGMPNQPWY
jgi:hypothetical protein